jgi:tRNA1Val (adenine37-N6)-methyltransferase
MANNYFIFKQFRIDQTRSVFKVGTDGVLIGACADLTGAKRILDIGTGTGLIAIMMAQRSDAEIIAIEPDENSYLEACDNVKACKWAERIRVEMTLLQKFFPEETERFDIIISLPISGIHSETLILINRQPAMLIL